MKSIRDLQIDKLTNWADYDVIVIGGGATGLGTAVEASYKGLRVALFEKYDFAKGTSSKSTKLLHGGVRYLAQGNIGLVFSALRERGRILKNAPQHTHVQDFIIPVYSILDKYFYLLGLKIYDLLAGNLSLGKTRYIDRGETIKCLPCIKSKNLYGGIIYTDGGFDDAALAISLALTATHLDAVVLNYFDVASFIEEDSKVIGVNVIDQISNIHYRVKAKVIINATGVFAEQMTKNVKKLKNNFSIVPSRGSHIVVDRKHFDSDFALMIPKTSDGRVLFAVPFHGKVLVGTTDKAVKSPIIEPVPSKQEISFIINTFNQYAELPISKSDILSMYAGLRPLVKHKGISNTSKLKRDHTIVDHRNGLVTITGGKWTTYRKMAEDVVKIVAKNYGLHINDLSTKDLVLQSSPKDYEKDNDTDRIHALYTITSRDVVHAYYHEFAVKAEDFLARRSRLQLLDANACIQSIDRVLKILQNERNTDQIQFDLEKKEYLDLIKNYLPD